MHECVTLGKSSNLSMCLSLPICKMGNYLPHRDVVRLNLIHVCSNAFLRFASERAVLSVCRTELWTKEKA